MEKEEISENAIEGTESKEKAKEDLKLYDIEKNFDEEEIKILEDYDYPRPMILENYDNEDLEDYLRNLKDNIKILTGTINGKSNKENPDEDSLIETEALSFQKKYTTKR